MLAAVFGSLAGTFLFMTVVLLTHDRSAALLSVALFSFSRLTWMYSITAEVFSLNNFFVALLILTLMFFYRTKSLRVAYLGAFLSGLALTNQHTIVLYIVVIVVCVLYQLRAFIFTPLHAAVTLSISFVVTSCHM